MPPPVPRCSSWAYSSLVSPSYFSLPRYGSRVGLHIDLFEACSAFTRVAACTLALSPIRDTLIEGFSHFVTSMTAPIASGWSGCRVGLAPTGKRRLSTAHAKSRHSEGDRRIETRHELKRSSRSAISQPPQTSNSTFWPPVISATMRWRVYIASLPTTWASVRKYDTSENARVPSTSPNGAPSCGQLP